MKRIPIICIICSILFFFTSCASAPHVKKYYKKLEEQTVFVETIDSAKAVACREEGYEADKTSPLCETLLSELPELHGRYAGTGTFVKHNGKIIVLTAEHVCFPDEVPDEVKRGNVTLQVEKSTKITVSSRDFSSKAKIIKKDAGLDLCILELEKEPKVRVAKIAKRAPARGDMIFYAGAPFGMMSDEFLLTYSGQYSGKLNGSMVFALPCAQGASGSGIRNRRNRIVSMVQRVHPSFNHVCFGVSTDQLIQFMSTKPTGQ